MSFRRIIVCLLVLALALPWPALGHALATTAAGVGNEAAPITDSMAQTNEAPADKTGHGKGNGGCHGQSSLASGKPATDSTLARTDTTANATAAVDSDSNHDCCSDGCDCGCLTTASSATLAVPAHHATPRLVGGFIATTAASVTSPRLLRPPIPG